MTSKNGYPPLSTKIYRFLDKEGLLKTLGLKDGIIPENRGLISPTFFLKSSRLYREMEESHGDPHEIKTYIETFTTKLSSENLNPAFISCWSPKLEWGGFAKAIAAIESIVKDVSDIINDIAIPASSHKDDLKRNGSIICNVIYHNKVIRVKEPSTAG